MATSVEDAIDEIKGQLEDMAAAHEGLNDYYALDLLEPAKAIIFNRIQDYDRRRALLLAALASLEALMADGYPNLETMEIPADAYADLEKNYETIKAALAAFEAMQASTLNPTASAPEPK